jgi:hypothetical protein
MGDVSMPFEDSDVSIGDRSRCSVSRLAQYRRALGARPQERRSGDALVSAGRYGVHHGGHVLELSLDRVAGCVAARAVAPAIHRKGAHTVS